MSFHHVMPHYLDFLQVYASPHGEDQELHFSGFSTEKVLVNPVPGTDIPELGRSGRRFQLCYNLKAAAPKDEHNEGTWKIRQAVIHHQFDVGQGTQVWMIGDPHAAIKERIGDLYSDTNKYPTSFSDMGQSFRSSMHIHLVCARWAASEWKRNVKFLEKGAEDLVRAPLPTRERYSNKSKSDFNSGSRQGKTPHRTVGPGFSGGCTKMGGKDE